MNHRIGLIHATLNAVQPVNQTFREIAPHVKLLNFLDEGMISEINEVGEVTPRVFRRFISLVTKAEESGVDGILLTCSSFTPYVPLINELFSVPVVSADFSMLQRAVELGKRIGVLTTIDTAASVTSGQLKQIAGAQNKVIEVHTRVITEAFLALQNGDVDRHNELIAQTVNEISTSCDVVVLAQISMSGATKLLSHCPVPVLTSPEISVRTILDECSKRGAVEKYG